MMIKRGQTEISIDSTTVCVIWGPKRSAPAYLPRTFDPPILVDCGPVTPQLFPQAPPPNIPPSYQS